MNRISWFEIPVADLDRAMDFYGKVFETEFHRQTMDQIDMAIFPHEKQDVSGALAAGPMYNPAGNGTIVYFYIDGDLTTALDRAIAQGSEVTLPKTPIGPNGFIALFKDSEGNIVGLHSMT